jgi:hypothetical protein
VRSTYLFILLSVMVSLYSSASSARGDSPPDQQVAYYIRESPADPNSAVVFEVILELSAQNAAQDSVGWGIDRIELRQTNGGTVTVWTKTAPEIGSEDGLWWVQHANPAEPQLQEFALPPSLVGLAIAQDPEELDLAYDLAGVPGSQSPANVAVLTYTFARVSEPEPSRSGEDEPVVIDDPKPIGSA